MTGAGLVGENATEIIMVLLGGGLVTILTVGGKVIKDYRDGRTAREDSTIARWKEIADEHERSAERAWGIVSAYRRLWPRLWADFVALGGDRDKYPPDPAYDETH